MKKLLLSLALFLGIWFLGLFFSFTGMAQLDEVCLANDEDQAEIFYRAQLIVKLKPGKRIEDLQDLNSRFNLISIKRLFTHSLQDDPEAEKKKNDSSNHTIKPLTEDQGHLHLGSTCTSENKTTQKSNRELDFNPNRFIEDIYLIEFANPFSEIDKIVHEYSQHSAVEYVEPNLKVSF